MTDLQALEQNVQILNNIKALLMRSPHIVQERQVVDQCLQFVEGLLGQSQAVKEELLKKQPKEEPKQVEEQKQEVKP